MMGIIEIDGVFSWSVSFTNDPRLPRMGKAATFEQAQTAVRAAIKTARQGGTLPTVDRRPPPAP